MNSYSCARYYESAAGRFLSEDPIEFSGDGVDFYTYVLNDPVDWFDDEGEGRGRGRPGKGDPGRTHSPDGTPNPGKKFRDDPTDPDNWWIYKDPTTGKKVRKPKPKPNKCESAPPQNPYWWLLTHPGITLDLSMATLNAVQQTIQDNIPAPPPPPTTTVPGFPMGPIPWWELVFP